jgi:zinc protease
MRPFLFFAAWLLASCGPKAPPAVDIAAVATARPADPLPLDPKVRSGRLDNGLTWYVEVNPEPRARAELRLVVHAGSVLEDEDQRGLAHLLEHLAFNGTEHFPGNSLVTYLESIGTRFGAHLNAYTSFDETVYMLRVPTDDAAVFDKGLLVLRDWAGGIVFDPAEIDKERGVVLEEWRLSLGPGERLGAQVRPLLFAGSPYADRMPIGTEESLRTFTPEAVERFYRDWYRPDLMAVVVVGDVDPDEAERQIREKFGDLRAPDAPRERPRHVLPGLDAPARLVLTDPEIPQGGFDVTRVFPDPEGSTHGDYRQGLAEGLAQAILNERLGELSRREDTPILGAYGARSRLTAASRYDRVEVAPKAGREIEAYELVFGEVRRFVELGPTEAELERARANTLRFFRAALVELDQTDSSEHAEEIIRVHLTGEPMPGLPYEAAMAERYVPAIDAAEVRAVAATFLQPPWLTVVVLPEAEGVTPPAVADLEAAEARVAAAEIAPLAQEEALPPLIAAPTPGTITAVDDALVEKIGFKRYTLSNGVTVYARNTDFKADEVVFSGFSPGGSTLLSDDDMVALYTGLSIRARSGAGALDARQIDRWLAGRKLSVSVGVGGLTETVSGSASPGDLDAALQLLHATVVAPRFDADAFALEREARAEGLRNRLATPAAHFSDAWTQTLYPDDPRFKPWTVEDLAKMDLERSRALYRDRFGDLSDLTLVVVGALPADFEASLARWVATLPAGGRAETARDRGFRLVEGEHRVVVEKGAEPQARVQMLWHGAFPDPSLARKTTFEAMLEGLRVKLRESLREDLGGVYGVGVSGVIRDRFQETYEIYVSFGCDPARADELEAEVERVFAAFAAAPPEDRLLVQFRETNRRSLEQAVRTNGFWLSGLVGALDAGRDPVDALLGVEARVAAVTAADVQAMAKATLDPPNAVRGRLVPEPGAAPTPPAPPKGTP